MNAFISVAATNAFGSHLKKNAKAKKKRMAYLLRRANTAVPLRDFSFAGLPDA